MIPLKTKLRKTELLSDLPQMFDSAQFKKKGNSHMEPDDLGKFVAMFLKITLTQVEKELFEAMVKRYGSANGKMLGREQFVDLFNQNYISNSNLSSLGKECMKKVKKVLKARSLKDVLKAYDTEKTGHLCQRNLKVACYQEFRLSQAEIEILIEYLAKSDASGYFSIDAFESEIITTTV
jgi:Ca2+-binding EF-hand superfamily protein